MRHFVTVACLAIAPYAIAAPVVQQVQNAASFVSPTLPNGSLAPGSIFIVKGTGLGPATLTIAPNPFQSTTLSGTSVAVTIAGTTVNALMYYTSDKQLAALLPSNTPTGTGTIKVTFNGQDSPATAIRGVIANNLGIFTIDSSGAGPGIITYPDYSLVSPFKAANCGGPSTTCGAANPGETLILWGSGLGAVHGDDAAGAGLGENMPNVPLQLWVGNSKAQVVYQGRSGCCIGLDQIVFKVPDIVVSGCAVPVIAQIGNQVSNQVTVSIAASGRSCSSPDAPGVTPDNFVPPVTLGVVELDHFLNDNGVGFRDQAKIFFGKIRSVAPIYQPYLSALGGEHVPGTCNVSTQRHDFGDIALQDAVLVDGGSSFLIKGPNGSVTVSGGSGDNAAIAGNGSFLTPGDYTITGNGGKDIGPFTATVTLPQTPTLTSPTKGSLAIVRNQGLTVNWTPNGSNGHVEIVLVATDSFNVATTKVTCTAPVSAGTFTIPAYATFALPPTNNAAFIFQPGSDGPAASALFTATGVTAGLAQIFSENISFSGVTVN